MRLCDRRSRIGSDGVLHAVCCRASPDQAAAELALGLLHRRRAPDYLTRQADAQFDRSEIDRACTTADSALDLTESISSHRTVEPLLSLADRLAENGAAAGREFSERARSVLAAQPSTD